MGERLAFTFLSHLLIYLSLWLWWFSRPFPLERPRRVPLGRTVTRLSGMLFPPLLIAAEAGLLSGARADEAGVEKELAAIYARFDRAAEAKDSGPLQRLIQEKTTPDGIVQRPGFTDTREEWIRRVKASQAHWQPARQAHTTIDRLTIQGAEATALASVRMSIVSTLPVFTHDPTGKPHTFVTLYTNRDVWRNTPAGWKRKRTQNVRFKRFMDGRLVTQLPRPGGAKASPHGAPNRKAP
jgi:hypothetical protein